MVCFLADGFDPKGAKVGDGLGVEGFGVEEEGGEGVFVGADVGGGEVAERLVESSVSMMSLVQSLTTG